MRGWDRLASAQMWAEDAVLFVGQAYIDSWSALLAPYGGYFHTFPRLVGTLASLLPDPALVPYFIAAVCYLTYAFVASEVTRPEYRWFLQGRCTGGALALLLCLLPGMEEVLGNLSNIHWLLFAWLALLGLRDPARSYGPLDAIAVFLAASSEGMVVLLLPLFLYRLGYAFRHQLGRGRCGQEGGVVALLVLFTLLNMVLREARSHIDWSHISDPVAIALYTVAKYHVLNPWLGYDGLRLLLEPSRFVPVGLLTCGLVLWWGFRLKNPYWQDRFWLLVLFVMAFAAVPALIWVVRPGNAEIFLLHSEWFWQFRYAFIATFAGFVLWLSLLSFVPGKTGAVLLAVFLVLNAAMALPRFFIGSYGEEQHWVKGAPQLKQSLATGCPERVTIPVYPSGWTFNYVSPVPCPKPD